MRHRPLALTAAMFLAAAAPSTAARAQPAPDEEPAVELTAAPAPPPVEPEAIEITVIGDRVDALQRVPGSGTLVTRKEIERAQPRDVAEMLRRVPGVTARQERDGGNRIDIGIRGFDAPRGRRVLLLEDGVPLGVNPYGEPDLFFGPPVDRVRGIEVVKGSGSVLFGPQTLGAVINFLTITPPPRREVTLALEGGAPAYAKVLGRAGDAVGEDGRTRYVAQIFHERGDGFREQPFHATNFLGKIQLPTSTLGEATLKLSFHDEVAHSTQVGLTREMFEQDPRRPTLGVHDQMSIRRYDASLLHDLPLGEDTTLRTLVFAYTTSRVWRNQKYDRAAAPGRRYERVVGDVNLPNGAVFFRDETTIPDRSFDVLGVEPRLEHRFSTGGLRHTLHAGVRFLAESAHRQQRSGGTATSTAGALETDETSFTYAFAAYAQDTMAATEHLVVTPGLRFEYARSQRDINRYFTGGAFQDAPIRGTSDVTELLPGIGLIAGSPRNHAFAGLHAGFAPPRLTTSIRTEDRIDGPAEAVDAQLDAERSIHRELGARLTPIRWLRLEATGFLSTYANQVIPSAGADKAELKNAGQTRHHGVEGGASLGVGEALDLGLTLDVGGRYTFSRAYFVGGQLDGSILPFAPLHTGSATLDVEHPSGAGAQLAVHYVGDQLTDDEATSYPEAGGRVGIMDARAVVDVAARYRHRATGLTGTLSVKNALDHAYVQSRRPDGIFPGGFRQVTFGLRWDYPPPAGD